MDWVSFDEIKKIVSLQMALDHYGIRLRGAGPNTLRGKCPLPTHASKTSTESFTATLNKGIGGAWACQSQSCIKSARPGRRERTRLCRRDGTMFRSRCGDQTANSGFSFRLPGNSAGVDWQETARGKFRGQGTGRETRFKSKHSWSGGARSEQTAYVRTSKHRSRITRISVSVESRKRPHGNSALEFFPGRGACKDRCVIPIHNEKGELVAYAGRSIDGSEPRYKFPAGFHKSLELYNLHRAIGETNPKKRIVVVEGFFDCMRVTEAGFPCVALMGSAMSETQEELLVRNFSVACLLFDGDEAGQQASTECLQRLGRSMWVWAPVLPEGKQPDMLSPEEIRAVLKK